MQKSFRHNDTNYEAVVINNSEERIIRIKDEATGKGLYALYTRIDVITDAKQHSTVDLSDETMMDFLISNFKQRVSSLWSSTRCATSMTLSINRRSIP